MDTPTSYDMHKDVSIILRERKGIPVIEACELASRRYQDQARSQYIGGELMTKYRVEVEYRKYKEERRVATNLSRKQSRERDARWKAYQAEIKRLMETEGISLFEAQERTEWHW